ncbi:MAG: aspartate kinase [Pelagibacteraceae bacterium]|jgi:aspartate kinase|nr:aspartate kinase [Pelagibacteraceae bacterium]MBT3902256.1 aspartate kinase [Pelagibacteraceae bacterium]MBT4644935.1 aspartate kinase [Pelagibacteraceae bacterium]MBT6197539.1 aspartate kinase [Pelagibacteraceae bacterium]MBT6354133.1 aspartate kinase [Pelagibacteraceae bacterium]
MKTIVMKFGGTSVAGIQKLKNIVNIVSAEVKNHKVIVVLSAMAGETNKLQSYLDELGEQNSIESDLVLTSGEQVTIGLLSSLLKAQDIKSIPLLGWQIPIITDNNHEKAKILKIDKKRIEFYFENYDVIVLAGFQGINIEGNITSLGRGGSDTTAVAIASAIKAERCDIYTDVEGVYSTDPNIEKKAKKISKMSYEEMLEMASTGAKVLHTRSVELAMKNNLTLQVLSSLTKKTGTFIVDEKELIEKEIVSGVSYSDKEAKVTISGILDKPGISAQIFSLMTENNINVDMIVQNISQDGISANITFTINQKDYHLTKSVLEKSNNILNYKSLILDKNVAKISVIGMGMMSQSGVAEKMFKTLAKNAINILAISTSEIKISVLIDVKHTNIAVKSLHEVYNL